MDLGFIKKQKVHIILFKKDFINIEKVEEELEYILFLKPLMIII